MACTVDTQLMTDQDLSLVSPSSSKRVPRKFKKPASSIPPPINLDELYESTDASTITPAHPKRGFKLTKKLDPDFKRFSKAFETTLEDESMMTCAQLKDNPFKRNFRSKKDVEKRSATFSKAFETSTDQDLTLGPTSRAANFRSNKEKAKSNYTFSKGFESTCRNDSSLHLLQPTTVSSFKHKDTVSKCYNSFSQAVESAICLDFVHTLSLNNDETSAIRSHKKTGSNDTFTKSTAVSQTEKSAHSCHLNDADSNEEESFYETPNPIEQFAQTLSNISPILPEKIEQKIKSSSHLSLPTQDFSTKFSTNLSGISEESSSNDADKSSAADDSDDYQKTICSISNQLAKIEAEAEIKKEKSSTRTRSSSEIRNDAREWDSSSEFGVSNESPSPSTVRRRRSSRSKLSQLLKKKYSESTTYSHSMNVFTDHELSLHLLSKCTRRKKPLPVSVKTTVEETETEEVRPNGRLKRPAYWATNKLYNFIKEKIMIESDSLSLRTEKFVHFLSKIVTKTINTDKLDEREILVDRLKSEMIDLRLVKSDFYFYHFIQEFLPFEFIDVAVPSIIPFYNELNVLNYKPGNLFRRYFS